MKLKKEKTEKNSKFVVETFSEINSEVAATRKPNSLLAPPAGWLAGWAPPNERRWQTKSYAGKIQNHWPAKWSFIVVRGGKQQQQQGRQIK